MRISENWDPDAAVCLYLGETIELLQTIPDASVQLVLTSPPYNLDKSYERGRKMSFEQYVAGQTAVIDECMRILKPGGSICWEVGNHVAGDEIVPLDIVLYPVFRRHGELKLRNRIVWHFAHGLHCSKRFSGRYETVLWFTYGNAGVFNLDPVRVPQKYPGKRAFRGPNAGEYSGNPLGKNPGDVWIFPNVKSNHIEKTIHPCQFPVEFVERLVLALTNEGDLVVDPYLGVGSTACGAVLHGRRAAGADIVPEYLKIARHRIELAAEGKLKTRPMNRPVYEPSPTSSLARRDDAPRVSRRPGPRPKAEGLRIALQLISETAAGHTVETQPRLLERTAEYGLLDDGGALNAAIG